MLIRRYFHGSLTASVTFYGEIIENANRCVNLNL
jgi:hypothetical protein